MKKTVTITGKDIQISDGYHTFDELYNHRIELYLTVCRLVCTEKYVWKSKKHHDGNSYRGWFVLGIHKKKGEQITYHLPMDRWDDADFAETLNRAPEFDGHTPKQVIKRLSYLL